MSSCIICYAVEEYSGVPNCPNCGRFLKWLGWDKGYSCKCNGIINLQGAGDDADPDSLYFKETIRICKKPEDWKYGVFLNNSLGESVKE